jgi:hypothetical protein
MTTTRLHRPGGHDLRPLARWGAVSRAHLRFRRAQPGKPRCCRPASPVSSLMAPYLPPGGGDRHHRQAATPAADETVCEKSRARRGWAPGEGSSAPRPDVQARFPLPLPSPCSPRPGRPRCLDISASRSPVARRMDAGTWCPFTFTLRDLVHKVAGKQVARALILGAAAINVFMAGLFWLVDRLPALPGVGPQTDMFGAVLSPVWRIVFASILAEVWRNDTGLLALGGPIWGRRQWGRVLFREVAVRSARPSSSWRLRRGAQRGNVGETSPAWCQVGDHPDLDPWIYRAARRACVSPWCREILRRTGSPGRQAPGRARGPRPTARVGAGDGSCARGAQAAQHDTARLVAVRLEMVAWEGRRVSTPFMALRRRSWSSGLCI